MLIAPNYCSRAVSWEVLIIEKDIPNHSLSLINLCCLCVVIEELGGRKTNADELWGLMFVSKKWGEDIIGLLLFLRSRLLSLTYM